jgi:hypothetical protein
MLLQRYYRGSTPQKEAILTWMFRHLLKRKRYSELNDLDRYLVGLFRLWDARPPVSQDQSSM